MFRIFSIRNNFTVTTTSRNSTSLLSSISTTGNSITNFNKHDLYIFTWMEMVWSHVRFQSCRFDWMFQEVLAKSLSVQIEFRVGFLVCFQLLVYLRPFRFLHELCLPSKLRVFPQEHLKVKIIDLTSTKSKLPTPKIRISLPFPKFPTFWIFRVTLQKFVVCENDYSLMSFLSVCQS